MGKRILIADISDYYRAYLKELLTVFGHNVVAEASSGAKALVEYVHTSPDVVILDIFFHDQSGLEILSKIKSVDKKSKLIVCSFSKNENFIRKAFFEGAKAYLFKPIDEQKLKTELDYF